MRDTANQRQRVSRGGPRFAGMLAAVAFLIVGTAAGATVMKYMDTETLVSESDVIVRGHVETMEMVTDDRGTFRHTTIAVDENYMGSPGKTVTIEQWAGTVGREDAKGGELSRKIPGDASFSRQQEVIVFLRHGESRHDRDDVMYLSGLAQSKWRVIREGDQAVVRRNLSGLGLVPQDGGGDMKEVGEQQRDLESFEATLRSLVYAKSGESATGGQ